MAKNKSEPVNYIPYLIDDDKDKRSNFYGYEIPIHYYTHFGVREERSLSQRFTDSYFESRDFIMNRSLPMYIDAPSASAGIGVPAEIPAHYLKWGDKFIASLLYEDMKGYRAYTGILPEVSFIAEEIGNYPQYDGNFMYGKLSELQRRYNNDFSDTKEHLEWNQQYSYSERKPENIIKEIDAELAPINFFYNSSIGFDPVSGQFTIPDDDLEIMTKYYATLETLRTLERVNKTRGLLGEYKSTPGGEAFEDILPLDYLGTPRSWDRDLQKPETVLLEALDPEDRNRFLDERTEYDKFDEYEPMWDKVKHWGSSAGSTLKKYNAASERSGASIELMKAVETMRLENEAQGELLRQQEAEVLEARVQGVIESFDNLNPKYSNNQEETEALEAEVRMMLQFNDNINSKASRDPLGSLSYNSAVNGSAIPKGGVRGRNASPIHAQSMELMKAVKITMLMMAAQEELRKQQEEAEAREAELKAIDELIGGRKPKSSTNQVVPLSYNPAVNGSAKPKGGIVRLSASSVPASTSVNNGKTNYKTRLPQNTGRGAGLVSQRSTKTNGSGLRSDKIIDSLQKSMSLTYAHMQNVNGASGSKNTSKNVGMAAAPNKNISVASVNNNQSGSVANKVAAQSGSTKTYITGGSLDYINSIKSPIEIEEDKIQMLKDVAEREYNLKYAQLTPQMTVQFGDVRETADVANILTAIEQMTADALKSSLIGGL